eukprot:scaffold991_cov128-Cylindrotheca_fusiformis.AAC.3
MIIASLVSLFAILASCQSALAGPAGTESRFGAKERLLLQEEADCFQTDYFGNITTTCKEASGIESTCTVFPDGTCTYRAVNLNEFEEQLASFMLTIDSHTTDGETFLAIFGFMMVNFYRQGLCDCENSTPDCSLANLADYSFNACTASEPKLSYSCGPGDTGEGAECCNVDNARGEREMKCCSTPGENPAIDATLECIAGSNTGKVITSNSTCVATFNGDPCTCELCETGNRTQTQTIVGYDCTAVGGSQRTCPDIDDEYFWSALLEDVIGYGQVSGAYSFLAVDPRKGSGATSGSVPAMPPIISSLVSASLFFGNLI